MGDINIKSDELVKWFINLYSLPKYHEIDNKETQSEEVWETIKKKIQELYKISNEEVELTSIITASEYNKHLKKLKSNFLDKIKSIYIDSPNYLIVSRFSLYLDLKYSELCEQLMIDLSSRILDDKMIKDAKQITIQMFKEFDYDSDGMISIDDLESTTTKLGLPNVVAREIMKEADYSKDGYISYKEFEEYMESQILKYYKIFYNLDSDDDMKLNYKQAKQTLHEIYPNIETTDDIYAKLLQTMDQDKSGLISFHEWCNFLLLFPKQNLQYMIEQYKLYALTTFNPQGTDMMLIERDINHKDGLIKLSTIEIIKTFICGGISGGISRTITAPLENIKILFQTMYPNKTPSVIRGLADIYDTKGIYALFKGNSLSIFMSIMEQSMRFAIIEYSKKHFEDDNGHINAQNLLKIGIFTSFLSSTFLFPLEVVRVRIISSDKNIRILDKFQKIYYNYGFRAFYSGLMPYLISVMPAGSLNVMFYNSIRRLIITDKDTENPKVRKFMFIGGSAAIITGSITYPFTLLTNRMIVSNRNVKDNSEKLKLRQLISNTYINEGIFGFFKGYRASILRLIIGQSCNFGTYEILKCNLRKYQKKYRK